MNKEDIISSGLLELYALGIASPEEKAQVEHWLMEYPGLNHELRAIEDSLETYAHAYAKEPSTHLKDKIFKEITNDTGKRETGDGNHRPVPQMIYRIPAFFRLSVAAMLILLIGSIVLNYMYYNKYREADKKYTATNEQLQQANEKLKQNDEANAVMKHELNLMGDKNALPVVLNGTSTAPDALAKIYWMKNNGDIYIDPTNLPPAPEGKQYQFWAIINGKPVDGGMIRTEKGVYRIQKMKSFGHADAFAITLEKEGGSPVPHGETYAVARIL